MEIQFCLDNSDHHKMCGCTCNMLSSSGSLALPPIFLEELDWDNKNRKCCLYGSPLELMLLITADCEWKAQAGNICVASFDWSCSGICRSSERIKDVHQRCGEGDNALWSAAFWETKQMIEHRKGAFFWETSRFPEQERYPWESRLFTFGNFVRAHSVYLIQKKKNKQKYYSETGEKHCFWGRFSILAEETNPQEQPTGICMWLSLPIL